MLLHPSSGLTKEGYLGFSEAYFFLGPLVPLHRGEINIAVLHLILLLVSFGLTHIFFAFMYNKQHITRMLEKGYVLSDDPTIMALARAKLGIKDKVETQPSHTH